MTIEITQAIISLVPVASFTIDGDQVYENIQWLSTGHSIPSKLEVEAEVIRLTTEYQATRYRRQRAPEYPPLADLADALYWQANGDNSKMEDYLSRVESVKNKYPKGQA